MPPRTSLTSRLSFLPLSPIPAARQNLPAAASTSITHCLVRYARTLTSRSGAQPLPPTAPSMQTKPQTCSKGRTTIKLGTVISAGLMDRTVRVLYKHTTYNKHLHKTYPAATTFMVSDPRNSLREGDVIEFSSGWRASKNVRHVVERIVAPFGIGVDERPAVIRRGQREGKPEEGAGAEAGVKSRTRAVTMGKIKRRVLSRLQTGDFSPEKKTAAKG